MPPASPLERALSHQSWVWKMGRYCLLWLLDSEPSGMGTDTGSREYMDSFLQQGGSI